MPIAAPVIEKPFTSESLPVMIKPVASAFGAASIWMMGTPA
jgi:hypothetical protein